MFIGIKGVSGVVHAYSHPGQHLGPADICKPFPVAVCGFLAHQRDLVEVHQASPTCGHCRKVILAAEHRGERWPFVAEMPDFGGDTMKRKPGRPVGTHAAPKYTAKMVVYLTPSQAETIRGLAAAEGVSVSAWVRRRPGVE
uniref:Uncharacterized protein n=1 Tax=viral metagenome TaxID=1070528 RepID=A0A6H1Z9W8_9ZZZZ